MGSKGNEDKNAIVEYPDYQISVTQLKGPKGSGSTIRYPLLKGKWRYASYLDYQIPVTQLYRDMQAVVTQLKGPKKNGDMQAAIARLKCATYRR